MRRQYNSPRRVEQARQTRQTIIETALELFLRDGYAKTSMREIARAAGVAERTVYTAFSDKVSLLSAIADHAFFNNAGHTDGMADYLEHMAAMPGPLERLRYAIHVQAVGFSRGLAALTWTVGQAAKGSPQIREFLTHADNMRRAETETAVEAILGGALTRSDSFRPLIDELDAITGPEVFLFLTSERGWTFDAYENFAFETCLACMRNHGIDI